MTPRNPAGCGNSISRDCFTLEGGESVLSSLSHVVMYVPHSVPTSSPANVSISRSTEDPSTVVVTWLPFTLVEARGFIQYIVQLHTVAPIEGQNILLKQVPMDQSSTIFMGLDPSLRYEASVGTSSLSGDILGPGQLAVNFHKLFFDFLSCSI